MADQPHWKHKMSITHLRCKKHDNNFGIDQNGVDIIFSVDDMYRFSDTAAILLWIGGNVVYDLTHGQVERVREKIERGELVGVGRYATEIL